jgi:hypothetical protein
MNRNHSNGTTAPSRKSFTARSTHIAICSYCDLLAAYTAIASCTALQTQDCFADVLGLSTYCQCRSFLCCLRVNESCKCRLSLLKRNYALQGFCASDSVWLRMYAWGKKHQESVWVTACYTTGNGSVLTASTFLICSGSYKGTV